MGGETRGRVSLYANINRGLFATSRTPDDFAKAAERAVGEGFRAVKCAPFDEVAPGDDSAEAVRQARFGIQRVAVVRDAVGPDVTLMVDCHGRFDVESAVVVAEELAELGVDWFEEPVRPNEHPADSARIAACVSMTVAGGEMGYGEEVFADLIEGKAVEVIMPDVMFCGGAAVAATVRESGDCQRGRCVPAQPFRACLAANGGTRHGIGPGRDGAGARSA